MKVLVVHHGWLPARGQPVAGVGLRARSLGDALELLGHQVFFATRRRDVRPGARGTVVLGFDGPAELIELARGVAPDVVVVVAPEEAPALRALAVPVVLDLYAPRVLEAQFESPDESPELSTLLRAVDACDAWLVTTERQRYYLLGLLPMAGVDCREDRTAVCPLVAPLCRPPAPDPETPTVVTGGVFWPWQDPRWAVESTLATFAERGRGVLSLFGGAYPLAPSSPSPGAWAQLPSHPRLRAEPFMAWDALLRTYRSCHAALDLMAPNPERSLALAFREMDWIGAGLPLIIGAHMPLAEEIARAGAGWVVRWGDEPALRAALGVVLDDPAEVRRRGEAARALAHDRYSVERVAGALGPLLAQLQRRERRPGAWVRLAHRAQRAEQLEGELERARLAAERGAADRIKKDGEIAGLTEQAQLLTSTVDRLSAALEQALTVKAAEQVGRVERSRLRDERVALTRELAVRQGDLAKKDEEIARLGAQRHELQVQLSAAMAQIAALERERLHLTEKVAALADREVEAGQLRAQLAERLSELAGVKQDLTARKGEIAALEHRCEQIRQELDQSERARSALDAAMSLRISRAIGRVLKR